MENSISFKYNGKVWNPKNPEKKLKQLGITWDDVEIIETSKKEEKKEAELQNPKLYVFKNKHTGFSIESIYENINHLKHVIADIDDYEFTGMKQYE